MGTPNKRLRRPRNALTHQAILDAATVILRTEGYGKLTIERIAKVSGAGKPTIYRWWPNKTAILIEVFDRETTQLIAIEDVSSTQQEVIAWFTGVWHMWQHSIGGEAFRSIVAEIQSDPSALAFFNEVFVPHRRKLLRAILERAQARGELEGRDIDVIVDYCWGFNWYHLLTGSVPTTRAVQEVVATVR